MPSAAMMPNGRAGATPGRVVEVEAAAMLSIPTAGVGIGAAGREAAAVVSMPAAGAGIGNSGARRRWHGPPRRPAERRVFEDGHDTEGERAFT